MTTCLSLSPVEAGANEMPPTPADAVGLSARLDAPHTPKLGQGTAIAKRRRIPATWPAAERQRGALGAQPINCARTQEGPARQSFRRGRAVRGPTRPGP